MLYQLNNWVWNANVRIDVYCVGKAGFYLFSLINTYLKEDQTSKMINGKKFVLQLSRKPHFEVGSPELSQFGLCSFYLSHRLDSPQFFIW